MKGQRGRVTVVTKSGCVYCDRAKAWLDSKDVKYVETDWTKLAETEQTELRAVVSASVGGDKLIITFPQIFIGVKRVDGGCTGLTSMSDDEFDALLLNQGVYT